MANNISNYEAACLIKNGAVVVDVRDAKDFGDSHIPGALNINVNSLAKLYLDKNQNIIVVCSHGIRSIAVAERLLELGYLNVYNLANGYESFKKYFY